MQSNHKDPIYLNTRVEAFLESYFSTLKELTAQELEHNKKAVIDSLLEKPKNLSKVKFDSLSYQICVKICLSGIPKLLE